MIGSEISQDFDRGTVKDKGIQTTAKLRSHPSLSVTVFARPIEFKTEPYVID